MPDISEVTTSKVRNDHTHWRCMHETDGNECNTRLQMTQEHCTECGSSREGGSYAETHDGYQLGTLESFDPDVPKCKLMNGNICDTKNPMTDKTCSTYTMARTTTRCVDHPQWKCTKFLMPIDNCNATMSIYMKK
ncbi:hypothetical protein FOYG_05931 [Fusarium oxysporum NRRL 32931]|uniref:Uncharacterized protein n=1 Tax=Fusarium oxysporum NRRL 32931 TaxID=660029 RepID=W9IIL7_FUSOX|nr:hypothetical protein FOYG_05931 [Fusarium oxysporum NRRL 32931]